MKGMEDISSSVITNRDVNDEQRARNQRQIVRQCYIILKLVIYFVKYASIWDHFFKI